MFSSSRSVFSVTVLTCCGLAPWAWSGTIYVPTDFATIQQAIDAAVDGDTVVVADGIYTGSGNRDLNLYGKAITVGSINGPDACTIDCEGSPGDPHRAFIFENQESSASKVSGFTILNGVTEPSTFGSLLDQGGAILCIESSPTISDCVFDNNVGRDSGGAVANIHSSHPFIVNCKFLRGVGGTNGGGAVSNDIGSSPTFVNCLFAFNESEDNSGGGGAIRNQGDCHPIFYNCTFSENSSIQDGSAMASSGGVPSNPTVISCIFWGNNPVANQIFDKPGQANTTIEYSDIQGGWTGAGGSGNIDLDPSFVDAIGGDFGLAANSPCIDAGDSTSVPVVVITDLGGNPRFVDDPNTPDTGLPDAPNPVVDMGAFEFQVLNLALDIKPGSCPNSLNLNSGGYIPISILGSNEFDPASIDLSSVVATRADGVGGSVAPNEGPPGPHSVIEDTGTPFAGDPCSCHDFDGDEWVDLSMKFRTQDLIEVLELASFEHGDFVELVVSGSLLDGTPFASRDCSIIKGGGN